MFCIQFMVQWFSLVLSKGCLRRRGLYNIQNIQKVFFGTLFMFYGLTCLAWWFSSGCDLFFVCFLFDGGKIFFFNNEIQTQVWWIVFCTSAFSMLFLFVQKFTSLLKTKFCSFLTTLSLFKNTINVTIY